MKVSSPPIPSLSSTKSFNLLFAKSVILSIFLLNCSFALAAPKKTATVAQVKTLSSRVNKIAAQVSEESSRLQIQSDSIVRHGQLIEQVNQKATDALTRAMVPGPVGPQGPIGPMGAMGPMGPTGPQGAAAELRPLVFEPNSVLTIISREQTLVDPPIQEATKIIAIEGHNYLAAAEPFIQNGATIDNWGSNRVLPSQAKEWRNDLSGPVAVTVNVGHWCPHAQILFAVVKDTTRPDSPRRYVAFSESIDLFYFYLNDQAGRQWLTTRTSSISGVTPYTILSSPTYPLVGSSHSMNFFLNPGESFQLEKGAGTLEGCREEIPNGAPYKHGFPLGAISVAAQELKFK